MKLAEVMDNFYKCPIGCWHGPTIKEDEYNELKKEAEELKRLDAKVEEVLK